MHQIDDELGGLVVVVAGEDRRPDRGAFVDAVGDHVGEVLAAERSDRGDERLVEISGELAGQSIHREVSKEAGHRGASRLWTT